MVAKMARSENLPMGVMRSLRINKLIKGLTDEEIRAVLTLYRERGGFSPGGLGAAVSPLGDLQMLVGAWDMQGVHAEKYLQSLIEDIRGPA